MSDEKTKLSLITSKQEDVLADQNAADYDFGFPIRPALRLGYVEHIIAAKGILKPTPSRMTLIRMIQSGVLQGKQLPHKQLNAEWIVYEDSFIAWVKSLAQAEEMKNEANTA